MKTRTTALAFLMFFLVTFPATAETDRPGDMYAKGGWNITKRPAVPSDIARGEDMIPEVPPVLETDADVFDRLHPNYDFGREEMVIVRPEPMPQHPIFQREGDRD